MYDRIAEDDKGRDSIFAFLFLGTKAGHSRVTDLVGKTEHDIEESGVRDGFNGEEDVSMEVAPPIAGIPLLDIVVSPYERVDDVKEVERDC